jgi:hypothetical protein
MFRLGVVLFALATLFSLTGLALWTSGQRHHVVLTVAVLATTLGTGVALIVES